MVCVLVIVSGCTLSIKNPDDLESLLQDDYYQVSESRPITNSFVEPSSSVHELVKHMTLKQKVGQLVITGFEGTVKPQDLELFIRDYQASGFILFNRNIQNSDQTTSLIQYGNSLIQTPGLVVRLPLIWCLNEEGGSAQKIPLDLGSFISARNLGRQNDLNRSYDHGVELGLAMRALGLNTSLGPVFDYGEEGSWLWERTYSNNVEQVAYHASAVMTGLRQSGVQSIVQHFPGLGATNIEDSVYGFLSNEASFTQLLTKELIPYQNAIDNGAKMMLVSHLELSQLDPSNIASLSRIIINDLLREKMGFNGIVICDDLNSSSLTMTYKPGEAAIKAIQAGCDMVLVCFNRDDQKQVFESLYQACLDGVISEERLDHSVARIIAFKQHYLLWP